MCQFKKNKTSFRESLLWFYIILNCVSAGCDIYSSIVFCQYGRMLLFPKWLLYPLYVIFHLLFIVALRPIKSHWGKIIERSRKYISGEQDVFVS